VTTTRPIYKESAETVLQREQRTRTVKRCLIAAVAYFVTGGALAWLISKL
jgi:hypothetical protein